MPCVINAANPSSRISLYILGEQADRLYASYEGARKRLGDAFMTFGIIFAIADLVLLRSCLGQIFVALWTPRRWLSRRL